MRSLLTRLTLSRQLAARAALCLGIIFILIGPLAWMGAADDKGAPKEKGRKVENEEQARRSIEDSGGEIIDYGEGAESSLIVVLDSMATDDDLANLRFLKKVTELRLVGSSVTDKGIVSICGLRDLRYLDIWGGSVTDAGIEKLRVLSKLKRLTLYHLAISDKCLSSITELRELHTFSVSGTKISKAGLAAAKAKMAPGISVIGP